jgi:hypothetical protein
MIQVSTKALRALLPWVAKVDVRYYLKGVHIVSDPAGLRLTASNGHAITTFFDPGDHGCLYEGILEPPTIEAALKAAGKVETLTLDPGLMTLGTVKFTPIDGRYPDIKRAWPKVLDGKPCALNPALYGLVDKSNKAFGLKGTDIRTFHDSGCLVWDSGFARGVIMGLRDGVGDPAKFPTI